MQWVGAGHTSEGSVLQLHTFFINISTVTGAVWSTLSPGVPQGSGSLGGHVVAIGRPLLAAAPLLPTTAHRRGIPVWLPLPEGFGAFCHRAHHHLLPLLGWHAALWGRLWHPEGVSQCGALGLLASSLA